MFDIIAFDADDTLWHNETLFTQAQEKFKQLLLDYHPASWIEQKLYETEMRNLAHFGYGIKGFTLSMIETAIELSDGRIPGSAIQEIIDDARAMLAAPVEVLEGVHETVHALSQEHTLMVITKGDLFDQETKIARSGLGDYFTHIEIVSAKTEGTYRHIFEKYEITPARFLMVGNSLKSDVIPVITCGAQAVYVPYQTTWAHEQVGERELWEQTHHEIAHIRQLPELVRQLEAGQAR